MPLRKYYIMFFVISLFLTAVFFEWTIADKFIYSGDQFFRVNAHEAFINAFFLKKLDNLTVLNGWQFVAQFWDGIYYLIIYRLGFSFQIAERLLYFLVLFITFALSFKGFLRIRSTLLHERSDISVFIITIWYSINPYIIFLWHGGVYNLGSSLTYALAPLTFSYFHTALFTKAKKQEVVICALLLFVSSFTFWLLAPLLLFLIIYLLINIILKPKIILHVIFNSLLLFILYLPLVTYILYNILFESYHTAGNNNAVFLPTFGNELGGLWYQILLLFSWGIYNVWTPRAMFPFHEYYFKKIYIIPTLLLYLTIVIGIAKIYSINVLRIFLQKVKLIIRRKVNIVEGGITFSFAIILFISLFLAKGAQPPYGQVFLFLYQHVPMFNVFRTPDIRFGFIVVFCISVLLMIVSKIINKYIFFFGLLFIVFLQSPFFFTGVAAHGENVKKLYYSQLFTLPNEYKEVINYINNQKNGSQYVLPIPAVSYGHYQITQMQHHFGQDILSKFINVPFLYLSSSDGTNSLTYKTLVNSLKNGQKSRIDKFPIAYILFRKDVVCVQCGELSGGNIRQQYKKVFSNSVFSLYHISSSVPIISSPNATFQVINPIKYHIAFSHISKKQAVALSLSFNSDWKLFLESPQVLKCGEKIKYVSYRTDECIGVQKFFEGDELSYLWRNPLFEKSHGLESGYANKWIIDPGYIKGNLSPRAYTLNKDGSININFVIFYAPQSWLYLTLLISIASASGLIILLVKNKSVKKFKRKLKGNI